MKGIIGTIPTGNADTPEGKAAVAAGDVAAVGYPLWYMSRFTDEMPNLKAKIPSLPYLSFDASFQNKSVGLGGTGTTVYKKSPNADLAAQFVVWAKFEPRRKRRRMETLGFDPVNKLVAQDKSITTDPSNKFLQYFETNPFDVLAAVFGQNCGQTRPCRTQASLMTT